jgi:hypothetical protein
MILPGNCRKCEGSTCHLDRERHWWDSQDDTQARKCSEGFYIGTPDRSSHSGQLIYNWATRDQGRFRKCNCLGWEMVGLSREVERKTRNDRKWYREAKNPKEIQEMVQEVDWMAGNANNCFHCQQVPSGFVTSLHVSIWSNLIFFHPGVSRSHLTLQNC